MIPVRITRKARALNQGLDLCAPTSEEAAGFAELNGIESLADILAIMFSNLCMRRSPLYIDALYDNGMTY
jgi:hypothetical protein